MVFFLDPKSTPITLSACQAQLRNTFSFPRYLHSSHSDSEESNTCVKNKCTYFI